MRPWVCTATVSPPIGLPDPGLTLTVVMPPDSASAKARSAGLIASRARTPAVTGSVSSLVSLPAQPSASSCSPTWVCASMNPGSSHWPAASITVAPAGTVIFEPSATILPSLTRTIPWNGSPSMGTTCALTNAKSVMDRLCHAASGFDR